MLIGRKTVLLSLSVLIHVWVFSQNPCTGNFSGRILSESGEALAGATILLSPGLPPPRSPSGLREGKQAGQIADREGHFHFVNLCDGTYKVICQYLGLKNQEFEIDLRGNAERTIRLEPDLKKLEEVVVHGKTEHAENVQNYVRLSEKQLAESAGKTLGESLKEIPGVNTIQAGPGIFKPVIHGVHSQRVLILNHGIRQEGQQWGAEHAPEIDPFIAAEMVVIKDASAIKYGSDALGGVIIVNPPPLPEKAGVGGSFNSVVQRNGRSGTVSGTMEGGIKNHNGWGWRMQGTAKRTGDFHTPQYVLTNTGVQEVDFSASAGYHGKSIGAEIFFSHFQTSLGILRGTAVSNVTDLVDAMEREEPQYTAAFSYAIHEPRQEVGHDLLKINAHSQSAKGEWSFVYGFQKNSRREFDVRALGVDSRIPAIDLQLNTHTIEAEWETSRSDKRTLCFGLNGMMQDNSNVFGTQRIPFIPNFTSLSGGPFAVAKLFLDRWTIDLGARYDYRDYKVAGYDYKNSLYKTNLQFNNASGTAGASFQINKTQSLSLNVSTAWRPPHVAELYSLGTHQSAAAIEYGLLLNDSTNEVMDIGDVPFKIEKALKSVGTYRFQNEKIQVEATAYSNLILNYIYLQPIGITRNIRGTLPAFRYTQTDALFLGTDLTSTWQATRQLKVTPKVALLRASDFRKKDYLVFIPSNRYELAVRFEEPKEFTLKSFYFESRLKYTARQGRAPRTISGREWMDAKEDQVNPLEGTNKNFDFMDAPDGYFLLNLSAGFSMSTTRGRYDLRLSAENVLNASYREYTNRFRYYADDMGRNFVFSVKYIF